MRLLTAGIVLGVLLGAGAGTLALAQYSQYGPYDPYSWTAYNEGPGIKFFHDGMVFHPGLAAELGYDSNVFLSNVPLDAAVLRLRLHLDLATLPPQRQDASYHPTVEFRFGGAFEYRQYLSSDPAIDFARQFNGLSNIELAIKPRDPFSLRLYNNFIVTNDARNLVEAAFTPRLYERVGALATYRPRNGPLEIGLGDAFRLDYYFANEPSSRQLESFRSIANEANLYAQLRVLPQTSVKLEVRSTYISYYMASAVIPNSAPIRVIAAINSLIIPALGVSAYIGYGNSLHFGDRSGLIGAQDARYNSFVGGAELRLRILARMRLALGWARDFYDSIFASYVADDRLYLNYDHYIWRGLTAHLRFDTYFRGYGDLVRPASLGFAAYNSNERRDIILNLGVDLGYRVLSFMELGVSYSLLNDITDFAIDGVNAGFLKHMVLGRIDIAY